MKKDAVISLIAILIVAGITYGLSVMKLDLKPVASTPFSTTVGKTEGTGHVIMRVNGEPVTEEEFQAVYTQMPEDVQQQFATAQGKSAFAEQVIRIKLLEQEARRRGMDKDPRIAAALSASRMDILSSAMAQKLVTTPTDQAVRDFYAGNKTRFEGVPVEHILIAYAGGVAQPRQGKTPPPEPQALAKAQEIVKEIRGGKSFGEMAVHFSDDIASAERGGEMGTFSRGMLPPELEQRVFTLKPGEVSDPIVSRYGVHIFRVGPHSIQNLEQVRPAISRRVQQQNTLDRIEVLRKQAKVEFDSKFFPDRAPRSTAKKPS